MTNRDTNGLLKQDKFVRSERIACLKKRST
jgi:hypothetical protein